jgi:twitching motility protein PilJ
MSFLDKFKGKGRDADRRDDDLASMFDEVVPVRPDDMVLAGAGGGGGGVASLAVDLSAPTQAPAMTQGNTDSSILSEVNATETGGEYSETRLPGAEGFAAAGTGLPLIGHLPAAQQRNALFLALVLGLGGLIGGSWLAVSAANEGSSQVGTTGQALMQSQRLAKSVSQALLGSDSAFGEVRESADVLGKNLRALKDGSADVKAVSYAAQGAIEPLMPLVERAEKNAGVVLAQQKTLTQVGQALRAINRQSSELLETAETVSSLKLQQDASASS